MRVPFVDLTAIHASIKEAVLADAGDLIDSGAFINGPAVGAFEQEFAAYCGAPHCVGVASGLDALRLTLQAAGVGPGDEVIVPAHTFVATAEAVSQTGARPVLAEIGDEDANLDPDAADAAITERTRAILAVHLYGQMADTRRLREVADRHAVALHEDAAQAHGARRDGLGPGQAADAASFSFYPGKNLGAFGDAGAMTTGDEDVAARVRMLREHGQRRRYEHVAVGWTARLDSMQAIVLRHKLPLLDDWNRRRREAAAYYEQALAELGDLRVPRAVDGSEPVWHLYAVRTEDPAALADHLAGQGIATGRHYPVPVHLTEAYASLGHREGDFPVAEAWAREELSLPIFPGITEEQLEAVSRAVSGYFAGTRAAA